MRTILAAAALAASLAAAAAEPPPQPATSTDPGRCAWEWKTVGPLGVWAEKCDLNGVWQLEQRVGLPGFVLTVDGGDPVTVLQIFEKPGESEIGAILPELRARGYIPDDDECILEPASTATLQTIGPAPRTRAFYEIMPIGARRAALEATPADEVPEPPCGEYGWSTHGTRYFMTDIGRPHLMIYVNLGQDGTMFDQKTITLE